MSGSVRRVGPWKHLIASGLCGVMWFSGCKLEASSKAKPTIDVPELDDLDDLDPTDLADLKSTLLSLLGDLFPDLSTEELVELTGVLSWEEFLALKTELSDARAAAAKFADELYTSASERVGKRKEELAPQNDGFPAGLEPVGRICSYDSTQKRAEVRLSGVFNGKQSAALTSGAVSVKVDGSAKPFTLDCLAGDSSVDIVFLIDITGSMSDVIHSVRDSVVNFIDLIQQSGVRGTVSAVTFQDSVGVNTTFQQPAPAKGYERSPFFAPVSIGEATQVDALRAFVNRLEANNGGDAPENLAGAIDFARNSVIGYTSSGEPNVIGDGNEDPVGTAPFPKLTSARQVFVVLTDVTFHGDDRTESNSSLRKEFVPRNTADILKTLHSSGTTVHVSDPSWADETLSTDERAVDADYWAIHTGGIGEDKVLGYSLVDLELVVVAEKTGLLDITLDKIVQSSCTIKLEGELSANAQVELTLTEADKQFTSILPVQRF